MSRRSCPHHQLQRQQAYTLSFFSRPGGKESNVRQKGLGSDQRGCRRCSFIHYRVPLLLPESGSLPEKRTKSYEGKRFLRQALVPHRFLLKFQRHGSPPLRPSSRERSRQPQRLGGTGPRLSPLPPHPAQPRHRSAARALARARHLRGPAAALPAPAPPAQSRRGRLSLRADLAGRMRGDERRKGGAARGAGLTQHQVPGSRRALATCPAAPRGRKARGGRGPLG